MTKRREAGTTKEVVARMIHTAGPKRAALILGVGVSQTYAYADPENPAQASFDQVRRLCIATGDTHAAEDLALLAGGVFMPVEGCDNPVSMLAARSAQEHGEMLSTLLQAASDGHIDATEAAAVLREADEHIRAVVALRARVADIARGQS